MTDKKDSYHKDTPDFVIVMKAFELIKSFDAHWRSKTVELKFEERKEMKVFVDFMNYIYSTIEETNEFGDFYKRGPNNENSNT